MKVEKLTKTAVDRLQVEAKPYVAWCGKLPGFGMAVRPTGVMSFIAQYDFGGRSGATRRVTIGRYGEGSIWTADTARKEAERILHDAKRGIDHAEAKAKRKAELTVADLCDEYLRDGCDHKKASTVAMDRGRIERHIKSQPIGKLKISEVRDLHIEKLKKDIANGKTAVKREGGKGYIATGGKGAATRTIRMLGGIFSYAVKCKYIKENPRKGVDLYADKKGERFLSDDEFQRLAEALREAETEGLPWMPKNPGSKHVPKIAATARETIDAHAIAAIRLLMLTGCRLREILNLKWAHVDEANGALNLPDSKTGAKKVLVGAAAMQVFKGIPRIKDNPYVIAGTEPKKPRADLKRPWSRITEHAGLNVDAEGNPKPLRLHDLRHSFASAGIAQGMTLPMIGKLLGHKSAATTARYAHLAESVERRALAEIENKIAAAAGLIETAEIIELRKGAA